MSDYPKPKIIQRRKFETSGWRSICVARGRIEWPDGTTQSYNVTLQAEFGEEGDVRLIAEDCMNSTRKTVVLNLRRKTLPK